MRRLILAVWLLPACAAPNYIKVDQRFTAEEQEQVRGAAGDWQLATGHQIDLVFGERVDTDLTSITSSMVRVTARQAEVYESVCPWAGGLTQRTPTNARVMIVVDTLHQAAEAREVDYLALFRITVTHEMGHWLGLNHTHALGIMHATIPLPMPTCVTTADVAEYCRATGECTSETHGCPL